MEEVGVGPYNHLLRPALLVPGDRLGVDTGLAGQSAFIIIAKALLDGPREEGTRMNRLDTITIEIILIRMHTAVVVQAAVTDGIIGKGLSHVIRGVGGTHIGEPVEGVLGITAGIALVGPEEARGLGNMPHPVVGIAQVSNSTAIGTGHEEGDEAAIGVVSIATGGVVREDAGEEPTGGVVLIDGL